ncbi:MULTISPECIES: alpha/beta fold hydrolase [Streptomyces]|uniref:Pimeloyl-ACP methyl ester carboxylesterase n=2 Tax=Streptomyces TaxID=1883 RepID=A0ABT9LC69_STRGD|nr:MULTISPECIES: alpha/beta hydrolase [Streptomyces]MDP9680332.1 pimeloyl-ACP methyl ester carboxylesterase [Streptomyces griseoviridis]GGT09343.1 alpha/beta hydrolase [Streptomyces griseoviridis]GGU52824.1 alpha/beta hydrolase [Streptomyces daghestanicus]GHI29150.1 alpha/beta hydrolase [Streptomyces daghestanicus]
MSASPCLAGPAETRHTGGPGGERFAYRRSGRAGTTPLVTHPRPRGTMDHWDPKLPDLPAAEREVVVFDSHGLTASTGTPVGAIEEMAEGSLAFIRSLELTGLDVLGRSLGGTVAQGVALAAPGRVPRLMVAGSSAGGAPCLPAPPTRGRQTVGKPVNDDGTFLHLLFPEAEEARAAGLASLRRLGHRLKTSGAVIGPDAVRGQSQTIGTFKGFGERQEEFTLPALVALVANGAHGAHGVMIHSYPAYAMSQRPPNAKVILPSDAGHGFPCRHPEDFAHEVSRFLP